MGEELGDGRIGRRELLKKGAVAGGLVWASPMVFSAAAGAEHSIGDCADCSHERLFGLKYNNGPDTAQCPGDDGEFESLPSTNTGAGNCLTSSAVAPPSCLDPFFEFSSNCEGTVHTWILEPSLQLCQAAAKVGAGSPNYTAANGGCLVCPTTDPDDITLTCDGAPIDVAIDPTTGRTTVTITDSALSHSEILFCYTGSPLDCIPSS